MTMHHIEPPSHGHGKAAMKPPERMQEEFDQPSAFPASMLKGMLIGAVAGVIVGLLTGLWFASSTIFTGSWGGLLPGGAAAAGVMLALASAGAGALLGGLRDLRAAGGEHDARTYVQGEAEVKSHRTE